MTNKHLSRRDFLSRTLRLSSAVAGLGLSFHSLPGWGAVSDYKALVCVQLLGGNDGNNLIVPVDATPYSAYQAIRGGLALSGTELLDPIQDGVGNAYALHYGLAEINNLFQDGRVAVVLNTGMLQQPLTRAQYQAGQGVPTNLFSHSDQTLQSFTGTSTPLGTGWAGRLLDLSSVGDSLAAVSVSSPTLMLRGAQVAANMIPPGSDLGIWGMNMWPESAGAARRQALNQIAAMPSDNPVAEVANQTLEDGIALSALLASSGDVAPLATVFPGTSIGNQLRQVMTMIRKRAALGPGRQVFFCSLEGFDTHSAQDWQHWSLLSQLSQAVAAFDQASQEAGLANQIATFTQSEFGRTLQPSGSGCDHGWGAHHLVVGGPVVGGIYGQMPTMALGGPDDANNRGVWIPTISTAQMGATLAKWFGASAQELDYVFPNLSAFSGSPFGVDVGFMG